MSEDSIQNIYQFQGKLYRRTERAGVIVLDNPPIHSPSHARSASKARLAVGKPRSRYPIPLSGLLGREQRLYFYWKANDARPTDTSLRVCT